MSKPEDPGLFDMMRGFGLDSDQQYLKPGSGFERVSEGTLDTDSENEAFGIASLGDAPYIPGGYFEPSPGISKYRKHET